MVQQQSRVRAQHLPSKQQQLARLKASKAGQKQQHVDEAGLQERRAWHDATPAFLHSTYLSHLLPQHFVGLVQKVMLQEPTFLPLYVLLQVMYSCAVQQHLHAPAEH